MYLRLPSPTKAATRVELTNTNMAGCGIMRGEVKVVREVKLRARLLLQVRTVPLPSGIYACLLSNEDKNLPMKGELKDLMSSFIALSYSRPGIDK